MPDLERALRTHMGTTFTSFALVVLIVIAGVGLALAIQPGSKSGTAPGSIAAETASSANGVILEASVNSTQLLQGQALNISLNLTNTQTGYNTVPTESSWQFQGVPVALWPPCYYFMPVQVAVLKGNLTLEQLHLSANSTSNYECMEGGTISQVLFLPMSDQVRISGNICVANCNNEILGPFPLEFNFTTSGYWDLQALSSELNPPILGSLTPGSLPSLPFTPGVYTIGVADEWGLSVVLHVTVGTSNRSVSATCTISAEPTGFFIHLVPDSGVGRIPGLIVQVTPMTECGGSATPDASAEVVYVTNGSGWAIMSNPAVSGDFYLVYSFSFSGRQYSVTADWRPEQATFTTVGLPSGDVTTSYVMPKSCNFTCIY